MPYLPPRARRHPGFCLLAALWLATPCLAADAAGDALVARGKYLTAAGDCEACHTAPKGPAFAGGLAMDTPFGSVTTPNITPDRKTGIGNWTDEQFYRTMHDGIGLHGEYLYPVMPFPWFTNVSRSDVQAIKAYLFSLPAVHKPREPNHLMFPFSIRDSLLAWREVFFTPGSFNDNPAHSAQVNRGDYLVNGLGHCGECHNSRLLAGASKFQKPLQGGTIDNWYAPNITSDVRDGIGGWSDAQLVQFMKTGTSSGKGVAIGPMGETVHSLQRLSDEDLQAIAAYLKSTPPMASVDHRAAADTGWKSLGGQRYLDNCSSCHGVDGKGLAGVVPALAGNGAVQAEGAENVVRVILGGLEAQRGYAPMLAIGTGMEDSDVAAVANYVRQSWGNRAPATATADMVSDLRAKTDTLMNGARQSGCPPVGQPALAHALAQTRSGLQARLEATTEANMAVEVAQIVSGVRAAVPAVPKADLVNGLTAAYCRVVRGDEHLDWNAKALQLGHFSQLVYMQVGSNGIKVR